MKIAVVDLESTGPRYEQGDRIIQIGAVLYEDGHLIAKHQMYINPLRKIPDAITQLTGIKDSDVTEAPTFEAVAGLWYQRLKDCVFVAHNLNHDYVFLEKHFQAAGYDFSCPCMDTVFLAKILLPRASGYNLAALSQYLELPLIQAHDALADAWFTSILLAYLSRKVTKMVDNLKANLTEIVSESDHQELLFFQHPEKFSFKEAEEVLDKNYPSVDQNNTLASSGKTDIFMGQVEWILSQCSDKPHLLIEAKQGPLNRDMAVKIANQVHGPCILCMSQLDSVFETMKRLELQKSFARLKNYSSYIDWDHFQAVWRHCRHSKKLNQQEWILLAATLTWLDETDEGCLDELNSEFKLGAFLDKYHYLKKASTSNHFFQKALKRAFESDCILTDHTSYLWLIQSLTESEKRSLQDRHLIIDQVGFFAEVMLWQANRSFEMSRTLTLIHQVLDALERYHLTYEQHQIKKRLQSMSQELRDWVRRLEMELTPRFAWCERQTKRDIYYGRQDPTGQMLTNSLFGLKKQWQDQAFLLEDLPHDNAYLQEKWSLLIKQFQALMTIDFQLPKLDERAEGIRQDHLSFYYSLSFEQYQDHFYQFVFQQKFLRVPSQEVRTYIDNFRSCLLIGQGDILYQQKLGVYDKLSLHNFSYLVLENMMQAIEIALPSEYLYKDSDYQDQWSGQVRMLAELLRDTEENKEEKWIKWVVVNTKQQVIDTHQILKDSLQDKKDWIILGQTVSGSIMKLKRYAKELNRTVIVVQWQAVIQEQFDLKEIASDLFWIRLPFKGLDHTHSLAQADDLGLAEHEVFDQIFIPRMIQDFRQGIYYFQQSFQIEHWYLLDDRVFTKYYSKEIRQRLESFLTFNLQ